MKQRSLAFPIVLIGLGALFLINNSWPELSVWHLLADWWPVLLIAFGAIRVLEVLALYGSGRAPAGGIRPMGFSWVVALVALAAAATLPARLGKHVKWDPSAIQVGMTTLLGDEFDFPLSLQSAIGKGTKRVVLDHIRGSVSLSGSDRTDIQLDGHKTIRAYDRAAATKVGDLATVTFTSEGDTIFVRAIDPPNSGPNHISMDLEISVPKSLSVEARGRSGDLTISGVAGDVDISSQRGEVRLQDIGGNAKVDVEHCDLLRATNLTGNLDLQGSGTDVQLDRVDGQVTINGSFGGTLDFKTLAKTLHFASKDTDLRLEKLPGTMSLSLGDLKGSDVDGPIHLVTHDRDVKLDGFLGPVDIELGHGDIELKPSAKAILARVDVRSRSGNIDVSLPADKPFDLKATAKHGEVSNDYGDAVVSESGQGRSNTMRSANPAGPAISLVTERGEVSVRKLE